MNWGLLDLFLIELLDLPLCKFNLVNSEITYRKETYLKTSLLQKVFRPPSFSRDYALYLKYDL